LYLYTFTGQNNAVIQYEQTLNFLYKQTFESAAPLGTAPVNNAMVGPGYAYRVVAETGKQGSLGDSTDPSARAAAGIYSPSDFSDLKIKIVGDPDYLFQDYYNVTQAQLTREAHKRTVLPNGLSTNYGELYLQMTFLTGDDWNLSSGIVKLEPKEGRVRRVSNAYRINRVISEFASGKFTQDIEATLLANVDPERALVKGDYVTGAGTATVPAVNTDTTDTDSTSARQETTDAASQETGAFDTDGSNDLRTQEGGTSTVPQSPTGALPSPLPPASAGWPASGALRVSSIMAGDAASGPEKRVIAIGGWGALPVPARAPSRAPSRATPTPFRFPPLTKCATPKGSAASRCRSSLLQLGTSPRAENSNAAEAATVEPAVAEVATMVAVAAAAAAAVVGGEKAVVGCSA
jgi:hypothetical protein